MAVKIVHVRRAQEVRFGDRATAEQYAAQYGGFDVWRLMPVPREQAPDGNRADLRARNA